MEEDGSIKLTFDDGVEDEVITSTYTLHNTFLMACLGWFNSRAIL